MKYAVDSINSMYDTCYDVIYRWSTGWIFSDRTIDSILFFFSFLFLSFSCNTNKYNYFPVIQKKPHLSLLLL